MKKPTNIFIISIIVLLVSCDNSRQKVLSSENLSLNQSIESLDKNFRNDLVGLWKLFKYQYSDGGENMAESNEYLKIQVNNSFEGHRDNGKWFVSFVKDSSTNKVTPIYSEMTRYSSRENRLKSYHLEIVEENSKLFLKLVNITDQKREIFTKEDDVK